MALAKGESSFHFLKLATRAALAELWIFQGRLEEAVRLIHESIARVEVMGPRARLYLAQGKYELAAAVARQARKITAAETAALRLQRMAEGRRFPRSRLRLLWRWGKTAIAREHLEMAARRFAAGLAALGGSYPLLQAALHRELARAGASTAPAETIVNAEVALSIYQRLGAQKRRWPLYCSKRMEGRRP
jgi:hypothetical protein